MLERMTFGRTGHSSSRIIFGAAGLGSASQEFSDRILSLLIEFGINHIDTAASYGDSELRIGPWMDRHRSDFFLATKTGERTGAAARRSLEMSLERLQVDSVDLIQLHNLVEEDEWKIAHDRGGAVEALVKARDEGLVKFIGVTGHGTRIARMHIRSLSEFEYDSVLFPYNFPMLLNEQYRADVEELLAHCKEKGVAAQTIKAVARRRWLSDASLDDPHHSWYEPLREPEAISHAVAFVLSQKNLFLNSSSDYTVLQSIVSAAANIDPPSDSSLSADFEVYAMSPLFDGREKETI